MPISRKKSCAHCRQSKLRCNLDTPSCSQCMRRHFKCVYDGRDSDRLAPYSYHASSTSTASVSDSFPPVDTLAGFHGFEHPDIISGTATSLDATVAEDDVPLDFNGGDLPFDWLPLRGPPYSVLESPKSFETNTIELPSFKSREAFYSPLKQQDSTALDAKVQHHPHDGIVNPELPQGDTGGALSPAYGAQLVSTNASSDQKVLRRRIFLRDCVLTSVVLGQLTGYPKMMLEGELLPPFIQPPCHHDEEQAPVCRIAGRHKCLPEILAICAGLVEMFYSRTQASEQYVWKMIYAEQARLRKKVCFGSNPLSCLIF